MLSNNYKKVSFMIEITISYDDWNNILIQSIGSTLKENELYEIFRKLTIHNDTKVVLTINDKPEYVLTFDKNSNKFIENLI